MVGRRSFGDQSRRVGGTIEAHTAGGEPGNPKGEESGKITIIFLVSGLNIIILYRLYSLVELRNHVDWLNWLYAKVHPLL